MSCHFMPMGHTVDMLCLALCFDAMGGFRVVILQATPLERFTKDDLVEAQDSYGAPVLDLEMT